MNRKAAIAGSLFALVALACTCSTLTGGLPLPGAEAGGQSVPPVPAGQCDSRTTAIQVGTLYSGRIEATDQGYPANCAYYCVYIPDGTGTLDISLTNFDVDLDLYVGYGDFSAVFGNNEEGDVHADWFSNEFGTDDELVSIPNPQTPGPYYVEVCSYESLSSDFELEATTR